MIDLVITYLQFFSLIVTTPDVPFPNYFKEVGQALGILNLDYSFFRTYIPQLPNNFRSNFIVIVIVVPLFVAFAVILLLNSQMVLWWYGALLIGVGAAFAGGLSIAMPYLRPGSPQPFGDMETYILLGVGGGLLLFVFAAYLSRRDAQETENQSEQMLKQQRRSREMFRSDSDGDDLKGDLEAKYKEYTDNFHFQSSLKAFLFFAIWMGAGLILYEVIPIPDLDLQGMFGSLAKSFGITCLVVGLLGLVWFVCGLFRYGRIAQWTLRLFVRNNLMKASLYTLSFMYIPIAAQIVRSFNCNTFSCESGSRIFTYNTSVCESCGTCGDALCQVSSENVLEYDKSIQCSDLQVYFWPAALLMVAAFLLGIPYLFHQLTKVSTNLLAMMVTVLDDADGKRVEDMTETEVWGRQVAQSSSVAVFLFESYELPWRYWSLFLIIQKFSIVVFTVFIVRGLQEFTPQAFSITASVIVHGTYLLLALFAAPYIDPVEDKVAAVMQFCLTLTSLLGLALLNSWFDIPDWALFTLYVLNLALPVTVFLLAVFYVYYLNKKQSAAIQQRLKEQAEHDALKDAMDIVLSPTNQLQPPPPSSAEARDPTSTTGNTPDGGGEPNVVEDDMEVIDIFNIIAANESDDVVVNKSSGGTTSSEVNKEKMKQRAAKRTEAETKELEEKIVRLKRMHAEVDHQINERCLIKLKHFFMFLGVVAMLSLVLCLLGMGRGIQSSSFDANALAADTPAPTPAATKNYWYIEVSSSWKNFTETCCCGASKHNNMTFNNNNNITFEEMWICPVTLRRGPLYRKRGVSNETNGFLIREFCGSVYRNEDDALLEFS
eukprot:PhF_6_TR31864/c1_g1_i2/m.47282